MIRIHALLLAIACLLPDAAAMAQVAPQTATSEDIAIAFFKTANTNPDFDLWATANPRYRITAPARAKYFIEDEKKRLMEKWRDYDAKTDFVEIYAPVSVELKKTVDNSGDEKYWMYMSFGKDNVTYFPYKFLEYQFAVIPHAIETMMIQPLQKDQFTMMVDDFKGAMHGPAKLYLQLKPSKAYINQPYMIDGEEQWAMLTDIAGLLLKSRRSGMTLWHYSADW